jgi:hypothetical protein
MRLARLFSASYGNEGLPDSRMIHSFTGILRPGPIAPMMDQARPRLCGECQVGSRCLVKFQRINPASPGVPRFIGALAVLEPQRCQYRESGARKCLGAFARFDAECGARGM